MSSFTPVSLSWKDLHRVFVEKLHFREVKELRGIKYYQDLDGAIHTLQIAEKLEGFYVEDKLNYIGLSYKIFIWLLHDNTN